MDNNNTFVFVLAIHILLYLSIGLDIPLIRQCVGFIYLTFVCGFVILHALNISEKSFIETILLSVALSVAFATFSGLLIDTLLHFLGVSAPLSAIPSAIIMNSLTLAIFLFSQRKNIGKRFIAPRIDFLTGLRTSAVILYALSFLLLLLSVIGTLYTNVYLTLLAIVGIAVIFVLCTVSRILPSKYHTIVLFAVSLSLLYQASFVSSHIMGYDIFSEYYVFKVARATSYWNPPGVVSDFGGLTVYDSVLSTTILPTLYSTVLNVDGDLIFKVIYPFIFAFVPLFLYKTYEGQLGKIVGIVSAFFFIANPINFYGLESLSLAREMIAYLFLAAAIFSLLNRDMDAKNRKILFIVFSAALAVSAYSLSFIYAFFLILTLIGLRLTGGGKNKTLSLSLVVVVLCAVFAWYMFVSSPPLNKLSFVVNNFFQNFRQDLLNTEARLPGQYSLLSPTAQTTFVGLVHKLLIYLTQGLVVVGAVVMALKRKSIKMSPEFRWMVICSVCLLVISLALPNVATAINFSRFYRLTMLFLSPMFAIGGIYLFDLLKRVRIFSHASFRTISFEGIGILLVAIILSAFFIFSVGLANYVSGDYPFSYALSYGSMQKSTDSTQRIEVLSVSIPECDVWGAKWLAARTGSHAAIYADELGTMTLFDYTTLCRNNTHPLLNTTLPKTDSYIYLRKLNIVEGILSFSVTKAYPQYNISDISLTLSESDKIYSNGQSEAYYYDVTP